MADPEYPRRLTKPNIPEPKTYFIDVDQTIAGRAGSSYFSARPGKEISPAVQVETAAFVIYSLHITFGYRNDTSLDLIHLS
jgi:hypothetical protein